MKSGLGLDEGDQAGDGVTPFKQAGDMFDLTGFAGQIKNGSQKMQRLAAEKVHGAGGLQKDRSRSSHASRDNCVGDSFQEREVIQGKGVLLTHDGKRMLQAGFDPTDQFRQIILRKRCHRLCRQVIKQEPEAIIGTGRRRVNEAGFVKEVLL